MTDQDAGTFRYFRRAAAQPRSEPMACALVLDRSLAPPRVAVTRLAWTSRAAAIFREVAQQARAGGTDRQLLPYASLRAALQVQLPDTVLLRGDLGAPWRGEAGDAFLDAPTAADADRLRVQAARALGIWVARALRPWADAAGVDQALVDELAEIGAEAFAYTQAEANLSDTATAPLRFDAERDAILQVIGARLEGQELFDGLGPVRRVVRSRRNSNSLSFITWPKEAYGGLYSMVAELTVETAPYGGGPLVTVRAMRRRWLSELPDAQRLWGRRSFRVMVMGRSTAPIALEVDAPFVKGEIQDPLGPEYLVHALQVEQDLAAPLSELVARGPSADLFVGAAYATTLGRHVLGAGASTRDNLELFDAALEILKDDGFGPIDFEETAALKRVGRPQSVHKAIEAAGLLADVAVSMGWNDLDEPALTAAWNALMVGEAPALPDGRTAERARESLQLLREANAERLNQIFDGAWPQLVLLARTERERITLEQVVRALFGQTLAISTRPLPEQVHGPRASLPEADKRADLRFSARVKAWMPLAELVGKGPGSHVIVQATDVYDRRPDDKVNKPAGRYALANLANTNVQYLRPPTTAKEFPNYLHRVQAAVYDLFFGHGGLVTGVNELLTAAFPEAARRPRAIVGISVLTQSRTRFGASGGQVCFATRLDGETGRLSARLGWFNPKAQAMLWTPDWEPLFVALKRLSSPDITPSLGPDRASERDSYQKFVAEVVQRSVANDDRPLILLDSTTGARLWPWLTDSGISGAPLLGPEQIDPTSRWPDVRLVRIRLGHAGRVLLRKSVQYEVFRDGEPTAVVPRICPTMTDRVIRVSDSGRAGHYWATAGYFQMSFPRGLSVYRRLTSFFPVGKSEPAIAGRLGDDAKGAFVEREYSIEKETYRLPSTIEITVARCLSDDDPDRIAHFVASLRSGYGHTSSESSLPAPLFYETKARDYMTRFQLDDADAEEGSETPTVDDDEIGDDEEGGGEVATAPVPWEVALRRSTVSSSLMAADTSSSLPSPLEAISRTTDAALPPDAGRQTVLSAAPLTSDTELRSPLLPVPAFLTATWIRQNVSLSNAMLRQLHPWREVISRLSGFETWPAEKPHQDDVAAILLGGLRYPLFLRVITRILARGRDREFTIFGPFQKRIERLRRSGATRTAELTSMASRHGADVAQQYLYCITFSGWHAELEAFVETDDRFEDLRTFMTAARCFAPPFDWFADPCAGLSPGELLGDDRDEVVPPARPSALLEPGAGEGLKVDVPPLDWIGALTALSAQAAVLAGSPPDPATLGPLVLSLRQARAAARAEISTRPSVVSIEHLRDQIYETAEALGGIAGKKAEVADLSLPLDAPASWATTAEDLLPAILADLERAVELRDQATEIMASKNLDRLSEIATLGQRAQGVAAAALQRLMETVAELSAVAAVPQERISEPLPDVPPVVAPVSTASEPRVKAEASPEAVDDFDIELPDEPVDSDTLAVLEAIEAELEAKDWADPVVVEATPSAGDETSSATTSVDPLVEEVNRRIAALMDRGAFGLAYHLRRAAGVALGDQPFDFGPAELRLAAMSGHVNFATLQSSDLIRQLVDDAHLAVMADDGDGEAAEARRLLLWGAITPLALFDHGEQAAATLETLRGVGEGLAQVVTPLRDALGEAARSGLSITPALLRLAAQEAAGEDYAEQCRRDVIEAIDHFERRQYRFTLGNKLRTVLMHGDGEIGTLGSALNGGARGAVSAARSFAEFSDRSRILDLLVKAEVRMGGYRLSGIDGDARERMVGAIAEIAVLCAGFVQAKDAAPAFSNQAQRAILFRIRSQLTSAATQAVTALDLYVERVEGVRRSAGRFAANALQGFRSLAEGLSLPPSPSAQMIAVHGPLLWLPTQHFGRGWLPAPYAPEALTEAILMTDPPVVEAAPDALLAAVQQRAASGSHIGALRLVEYAEFLGVPEDIRTQLETVAIADRGTRREALAADVRDARLSIDRMQRMAQVCSQEEAQRLLSQLDRIVPDDLPLDVRVEERTEEPEGEHTQDFVAAESVVASVRARVTALLDRPRRRIASRLDTLATGGTAAEADLAQVRALVDKGDWVTAEEYLGFLSDGQALPEMSALRTRFAHFWEAVLPALAELGPRDLESIGQGEDFAHLRFSRQSPQRRREVADHWREWADLKRRLRGDELRERTSFEHWAVFLQRLGFEECLIGNIESALAVKGRQVWASNMQLRFPLDDPDSVLLPDFGSHPKGNYRVCLAGRMPTDGELQRIVAGGGNTLPVILFVAEQVSVHRRGQILLNCLNEGLQRVLVVDEAVVLYALSETEPRPLTLFELSQPFCRSEPYQDYGTQQVPPEVFVGRDTEFRKLADPFGSCIAYGGRRLGKTALLQHIRGRLHAPGRGVLVPYVGIYELGRGGMTRELWDRIAAGLPELFEGKRPGSADVVTDRIRRWLDADPARRILVLLDEADSFVLSDAKGQFAEFLKLQSLMDTTRRRFKFVLAGLHNVTRLVHTENPPLKQIAADPQRIGALMDRELADAEKLVTRPFAGMGYTFDKREDVWRILSYCNYYPVLVQKFCKHLLDAMVQETRTRRRPVFVIESDHVRSALESTEIAQDIGQTFDHTIKIELRYELIANIMAGRALSDVSEGAISEGMSAVEVRDTAAGIWPEAFREADRLSTVEDLLDEMEGLGVVRKVLRDRWALRSPAILRLLGDEEKVRAKLGEFEGREAPTTFDPRASRRQMEPSPYLKLVSDRHLCPLTQGQEHDILRGDVACTLVFGSPMSEIHHVVAALSEHRSGEVATGRITTLAPTGKQSLFMDELRAMRVPAGSYGLALLDQKAPWDGNWVFEALRSAPMRDGRVRLVLVGGPEHALRFLTDGRFSANSGRIRVVPLEPWSGALTLLRAQMDHPPVEPQAEDIRRQMGGYSAVMNEVFAPLRGGRPDRFLSRMRTISDRVANDPHLVEQLGIPTSLDGAFRAVVDWAAGSGVITEYELRELPGAENLGGLTVSQFLEFGRLMGLFEPTPLASGETELLRRHHINPLLLLGLRTQIAA